MNQEQKPKCKLSGQDGNVFNLIGLASRALRTAKLHDEAKEMSEKCFSAGSYDGVLSIICEYVDVC